MHKRRRRIIRPGAWALAGCLVAGQALAGAQLSGRHSTLQAQTLLGAGSDGEAGGGNDSETSTDNRPALQIDGTSERSGVLNGQPWSAQVAFGAGHQFLVDRSGGVLSKIGSTGSSTTFATASGPAVAFAAVPAFGNRLELEFTLDAPTRYTLWALLTASGTAAQDISANVQLQTAWGSRWLPVEILDASFGTDPFWRTGELAPGLYRMAASAGAEALHPAVTQAGASWSYELALAPAPEPMSAALWAVGLAGIVAAARHRSGRRS